MFKIISAFLLLGSASTSHADFGRALVAKGEYIELKPGEVIYAEVRPPKSGKPTLFLLNALTYSTENWNSLVRGLDRIDPEIGLVRYDMIGQGQTRIKNQARRDILLSDQVEALALLKDRLALPGVHVALGLSYGGAVAIEFLAVHPDAFKSVIAMSPYIESLAGAESNFGGDTIQSWSRDLGFPEVFALGEQLKSWAFQSLMYGFFPMVESGAWEAYPNKLTSVVHMAMGIRQWTAASRAGQLPPGKLHLSASRFDTFVHLDRIERLVAALKPGTLASYQIWNAGHKLPEQAPDRVAAYVHRILVGDAPDISSADRPSACRDSMR